jgi:hypothetical protein
MDLPLELRLKIYEYAIVERGPICINRSWQTPFILGLGSGFRDLDSVTEIFFKSHAFVYYLTSLNYGEPDNQPFVNRLAQLTSNERGHVHKVTIVCSWACKDVTLETIQQRAEEVLSKEGDDEILHSWIGKLKFAHTDETFGGYVDQLNMISA